MAPRLRKAVQPVRAAVDQLACLRQVAAEDSVLHAAFLVLEEGGQQARGHLRVVGQFRLVAQAVAEADPGPVFLVVRPAGELDEAAPLVARAVAGLGVAQVLADTGARVIEIEGLAAGAGVELGLALVDGLEARRLGADGGQRHKHHDAVVEPGLAEGVQNHAQVVVDVAARRPGEHRRGRVRADAGDDRIVDQGGIRLVHADGGLDGIVGDAGLRQALGGLAGAHRADGAGTEVAVDRLGVEARQAEQCLEPGNGVVVVALFQRNHDCQHTTSARSLGSSDCRHLVVPCLRKRVQRLCRMGRLPPRQPKMGDVG